MKTSIALIALMALATPLAAHADCTVRVERALQYGTGKLEGGQTKALLLDAYIPETCNGMLVHEVPPIGFVHGGGFIGGGRDEPGKVELSTNLARQGFAVFSIDYRLQGDKPVLEDENARAALEKLADNLSPEEIKWLGKNTSIEGPEKPYLAMVAVEDALRAKEWVNAHQKRFNIQTENWGLIGGSAGAATVMQMAYTADEVFKKPQNANAVVDMWGDMYPKQFIDRDEAPLLILHGTEDETVEYKYSTALLEGARKAGIEVHRITGEGEGHGFDLQHVMVPGTNMSAFDAIVKFFDTHLRG